MTGVRSSVLFWPYDKWRTTDWHAPFHCAEGEGDGTGDVQRVQSDGSAGHAGLGAARHEAVAEWPGGGTYEVRWSTSLLWVTRRRDIWGEMGHLTALSDPEAGHMRWDGAPHCSEWPGGGTYEVRWGTSLLWVTRRRDIWGEIEHLTALSDPEAGHMRWDRTPHCSEWPGGGTYEVRWGTSLLWVIRRWDIWGEMGHLTALSDPEAGRMRWDRAPHCSEWPVPEAGHMRWDGAPHCCCCIRDRTLVCGVRTYGLWGMWNLSLISIIGVASSHLDRLSFFLPEITVRHINKNILNITRLSRLPLPQTGRQWWMLAQL